MDEAERAVRVATQVAYEARRVAEWYLWRKQRYRWWKPFGPPQLLRNEERLLRFLLQTVAPSADLVRAGIIAAYFRDVDEAERVAAPVRVRASQHGDLSYRALYNLACYECARPPNRRMRHATRIHGHSRWPCSHLRSGAQRAQCARRLSAGHGRIRLWSRFGATVHTTRTSRPWLHGTRRVRASLITATSNDSDAEP